jgi:hypothetical protein
MNEGGRRAVPALERPTSHGGTASSYRVEQDRASTRPGGTRTAVGVGRMSAVAAADMWSGIVTRA